MSTTITLDAVQSALIGTSYGSLSITDTSNFNDHISTAVALNKTGYNSNNRPAVDDYYLLVGFNFPEEYRHRAILHAYARIYMSQGSKATAWLLSRAWAEESVTYNNRPGTASSYFGFYESTVESPGYTDFVEISDYKNITALMDYGFAVDDVHWSPDLTRDITVVQTSRGSFLPQLKFELSSEDCYLGFNSVAPISGTKINRLVATTFTFSTKNMPEGTRLYEPWLTSYKLFWRQTGTSTWYQQSVIPTGQPSSGQVIVPANTFPGGSIEYYIQITDSGGTTTNSDTYTLDTTDTTSTAIAVSPAGSVEDGSAPIHFQWNHINASGALQTKAELQFSQDGTWGDAITVTGSSTEYEAPANTFASGTWYWRVRTYNLDDVAGAWSDPVQLISVASPPAPNILVTDSSPRPAIQWQTKEQEAYQIQLSDIFDQTYYGTGKTWRCPVYLEDGTYTVKVRTQNSFGLWGAWATASLIVSNDPGSSIALQVPGKESASLNWEAEGYDYYLVYRNSIPIAKVSGMSYTDDYSVGEALYVVRGCYNSSNNYGLSNMVTVMIIPEEPVIKTLGDDDWLHMPYSSQQHRTYKASMARDVQAVKLSGHRYPVAEASEFYTDSLAINCAFLREACPLRLEKMLGQLVCLKTPSGEMAIGTLDKLSKTTNLFYIEYSIAVSQEDFREEISLDTVNIL